MRAKEEKDHAEQMTMIGTIHKNCPSTYNFSERTASWAKNKGENGTSYNREVHFVFFFKVTSHPVRKL